MKWELTENRGLLRRVDATRGWAEATYELTEAGEHLLSALQPRTFRYWLKLGYFSDAQAGDDQYWMRRQWVSDSPGRKSPRWRRRPRPTQGEQRPAYAPRYDVGDLLVIYVQGHGCPAIVEVTAEPIWDPRKVDEAGAPGEGDQWGVVTRVRGIASTALAQAPSLEDIGVPARSVMRKGHLPLAEWQFREAERCIIGSASSAPPGPAPRPDLIPVEQPGSHEGYEARSRESIRRFQRRESRLVSDYAASLELKGDTVYRNRIQIPGSGAILSDLYNSTRNQLIEAKVHGSRTDIRMAIGQLADYKRFVDARARTAVLLEAKPEPDLVDLLDRERIAAVWRRGGGFADNTGGEFT